MFCGSRGLEVRRIERLSIGKSNNALSIVMAHLGRGTQGGQWLGLVRL